MVEMQNDSDFALLAEISKTLRSEYEDDHNGDPWADSPFGWIKKRPSRQVGKIGEQLVAAYFASHGYKVSASGDSAADRIIAGYRVEIKFSTLWKTGIFKFQQIRDQDYDMAICLGVAPFKVYMWILTKDQLYRHVIGATPQHGGQAGTDTFWISVDPENPQEWLVECGGRLVECLTAFENLCGEPDAG
jgi:hypothetical protein